MMCFKHRPAQMAMPELHNKNGLLGPNSWRSSLDSVIIKSSARRTGAGSKRHILMPRPRYSSGETPDIYAIWTARILVQIREQG